MCAESDVLQTQLRIW